MSKTKHSNHQRSTEDTKRHIPLERSIVTGILKWLQTVPECKAIKTYGDAKRKGEADISGCIRGQRFELEVKRPGEKPTALQTAILEQWDKAGAVTGVVRSVSDARRLLKPYL